MDEKLAQRIKDKERAYQAIKDGKPIPEQPVKQAWYETEQEAGQ